MKILKTNLKRIQYFTHGYFAAHSEGEGKFLREVRLTLYDMEQGASARAYLYLFEGNVLLFSHRLDGNTNALAAIEAGDSFITAPADSPSLTKILNAYPGFQKTLLAQTSGPVECTLLNGKYLLLLNIQAPQNVYGNWQGSLMTIKLTGSDYLDRTDNILKMIREIVSGKGAGEYSPLHGTGAVLSAINAFLVAAANLLVPLLIIAGMGVSTLLPMGPVVAGIGIIGLYLVYLIWVLVL